MEELCWHSRTYPTIEVVRVQKTALACCHHNGRHITVQKHFLQANQVVCPYIWCKPTITGTCRLSTRLHSLGRWYVLSYYFPVSSAGRRKTI
eukprot:SAG31_NODE_23571_length_501_cov_1.151741_1_plen_92_part_00